MRDRAWNYLNAAAVLAAASLAGSELAHHSWWAAGWIALGTFDLVYFVENYRRVTK